MSGWERRPRRGGEPRRGQGAVEMALLTPLLVLMVVGALDLGRMFIYQTRVNSAIKEAALSALYDPDPGDIATRAYQESVEPGDDGRFLLGRPGVDFRVDSVNCYRSTGAARTPAYGGCVNAEPGDYVEVTGYYIFQPITSEIIRILPSEVRLRKTVRAVY